jgi:hypothetical protein
VTSSAVTSRVTEFPNTQEGSFYGFNTTALKLYLMTIKGYKKSGKLAQWF